MDEKEWDPDEPAPVELQKEQLKLGKEFLQRLKDQEKVDAERRAEYEAERAERGPMIAPAAYKAPSFEEVSAVLKKAWDEVERIMPTAGDQVKVQAFQMLTHAAAPPFGSSYVTG